MSVAEALALLKEFSNSECFSFTDQRLSEARFNATNMANMLRNDIIDVAYKPKNSNFEIPTNSRRKRSTGHLERMKRQTTGNGSGQTGNTTSNNCSSLDNIFTAADVSTFFMLYNLTSVCVMHSKKFIFPWFLPILQDCDAKMKKNETKKSFCSLFPNAGQITCFKQNDFFIRCYSLAMETLGLF